MGLHDFRSIGAQAAKPSKRRQAAKQLQPPWRGSDSPRRVRESGCSDKAARGNGATLLIRCGEKTCWRPVRRNHAPLRLKASSLLIFGPAGGVAGMLLESAQRTPMVSFWFVLRVRKAFLKAFRSVRKPQISLFTALPMWPTSTGGKRWKLSAPDTASVPINDTATGSRL